MVIRYKEFAFLTYPFNLERFWWCPLCGAMRGTTTLKGLTEKEIAFRDWEDINGLTPKEPVDTHGFDEW